MANVGNTSSHDSEDVDVGHLGFKAVWTCKNLRGFASQKTKEGKLVDLFLF
jgi:hypothetical protein